MVFAAILIFILSGCLGAQNVQMEEANIDWNVTDNYVWSDNGTYRFAVDYRSHDSSMLVYLRGTAMSSNRDLTVEDYYMEGNELIIETNITTNPQVGTRSVNYPDKTMRVYPNRDVENITHVFNDKGRVTVDVESFSLSD